MKIPYLIAVTTATILLLTSKNAVALDEDKARCIGQSGTAMYDACYEIIDDCHGQTNASQIASCSWLIAHSDIIVSNIEMSIDAGELGFHAPFDGNELIYDFFLQRGMRLEADGNFIAAAADFHRANSPANLARLYYEQGEHALAFEIYSQRGPLNDEKLEEPLKSFIDERIERGVGYYDKGQFFLTIVTLPRNNAWRNISVDRVRENADLLKSSGSSN